jgi:hypothetical protein
VAGTRDSGGPSGGTSWLVIELAVGPHSSLFHVSLLRLQPTFLNLAHDEVGR